MENNTTILQLINKKKEIIESLREEHPERIIKTLDKLSSKLEFDKNIFTVSNRIINNIIEQFLFNRWKSDFGDWRYEQNKCNRGPLLETEFNIFKISNNESKAIFYIKIENHEDIYDNKYYNMNENEKIDCIYQLILAYLKDPYFCININEEFSPYVYKDLINLK